MKNEKIEVYGTFGPACKSQEILEEMIQCGMTGMRLNLSHTTLEKSKEYLDNYKDAAQKYGVMPQILIDMQGPELRIGEMEEYALKVGDVVVFIDDAQRKTAGTERINCSSTEKGCVRIPIPTEVVEALEVRMEVLLDDGKIKVLVEEAKEHFAIAKVMVGGGIKPHKSIKIVGENVTMPILTEHDIENIRHAKEYGVTALMQPFVFSGEDLKKVRAILKAENAEELQIFAKIENCIGVENLNTIIPEADMIVIARGDLGNDMPLWQLPGIQKKIEDTCKKYMKPYMVVTQMLASMEERPIPTRAEVSDIFHATFHGAKAVMVTGETAVGKYPREAISFLAATAMEGAKYRKNIKNNVEFCK